MTTTEVSRQAASGPPPPAARRSSFRGDVDGLRAMAIILVVAYHALVPGFRGGFIGVDVFFVISGWLITRNLLSETDRSGRVDLVGFWAKRIRRLVPALGLMVVAVMVLAVLIMPSIDWPTVAQQARSAALYISNIVFARQATSYFGPNVQNSLFLHTWSLGVEEQFYLVWPLIVGGACVVARRRRLSLRPILLVGFGITFVASLTLCVVQTGAGSTSAFYLLPSRAWEFAAAGLLAAVGVPSRWLSRSTAVGLSVIGLGLLAAGTLLLSDSTAYPGLWALIPVVATLMLIVSGQPGIGAPAPAAAPTPTGDQAPDGTPTSSPNPFTQLFATGPAQWLGRVSYSWYLWHWPFILLAVQLFDHNSTSLRVVAALAALGVAAVALTFVENRVRFSKRLIASRPRTYALGAGVTVVVVLGTLVYGSLATRANSQGLSHDLAVLRATKLDRSCAVNARSPLGLPYCEDGDLKGSKSILLIGDSRAGMLQPAFVAAAKADGYRLYVRWIDRCPAAPIAIAKVGTTDVEDPRCVSFRRGNQLLINELHPDAVVVSQRDWMGQDLVTSHHLTMPERVSLWTTAYQQLLSSLKADHVRIGRVVATPELPFDPIECMATKNSTSACGVDRTKAYASSAGYMQVEADAARQAGDVPALDLGDAVCPAQHCPMKIGGNYVWIDDSHLNKPFVMTQVPAVSTYLRQLVG